MGRSIPRPLVAQAVIVIVAVALFSGVLTIAGSIPTSNIPEHVLRNASATAMPVPGVSLSATVTPAPGPVDRPLVRITPVPEYDDRLTPTPEPDVDDMMFLPDMGVQTLPVNLSGSGSQTTESFNLLPGMISFDIWNDAPGNLEVWLMFDGERFVRLLENGVITEVPVVENIINGGTYFLDVKGDGEWKINVSQAVSG